MKNASICCIMESGARATANGDLSVSYALWVLAPLCPRDVGLFIVKSTFVLEWRVPRHQSWIVRAEVLLDSALAWGCD